MKYSVLVNLLDQYNYHNIIASLKLKPDKIVFLHNNSEKDKEDYEIVKKFLQDKLSHVKIISESVLKSDKIDFEEIIKKYKDNHPIINISGGSKISSIIMYQICEQYNIPSIYVDVESNVIFSLKNNNINEINGELYNLDIQDFVEGSGGEIIKESTDLFNREDIIKLTNIIIEDLPIWNKLKYLMKDSNTIKHSTIMPNTIIVNTFEIKNDLELFKSFTAKAMKNGLIHTSYVNRYELAIEFKNIHIKDFVFKIGTWLEAFTYRVLKKIKKLDDVKGGVLFLWDEDIRYVKNEIDVVASSDSGLICISCKDTSRYDEEALNELLVYAEQIGGENVKKILVTTQESHKRNVPQRAEEMGINIIIFDGDVDKFEKNLRSII